MLNDSCITQQHPFYKQYRDVDRDTGVVELLKSAPSILRL